MRQRIRAIRQNDKGFTLIELLIVIIILGVLAGVVVLAVSGISDRGTNAACKSDVKAVEVAAEAFYAKTGGYPLVDANGIDDLVKAGYLHSSPNSTEYTVTYDYTAATTGTTPTLAKVEVKGDIKGGAVTADCSA